MLRRGGNGEGWWINPNTDMVRNDEEGITTQFRLHLDVRCTACGLNVAFTVNGSREESTLSILDSLVDGGVSEIELRRLCEVVSTWR